ncbi:MAG: response regulator transcription factor [Campylobacteraceae bacterium]
MSNLSDLLKKVTILLVEDEDNIRKALKNAIEDEFKDFYTAKDGEEGVKKFKKYKPDIVITDILMPIKDGLELTKDIKAISRDTPVLVLSAFSEKERLLGAIDAGVDKYLIKPIHPDDLLKVLEQIAKEKFLVGNVIDLGDGYQFDKNKRVLIRDGKEISLTKKEILFISFLVKYLGAFVLHEDLKKSVWSNK